MHALRNDKTVYTRPSVARTLMARLLRLLRTRSLVPWKNPFAPLLQIWEN